MKISELVTESISSELDNLVKILEIPDNKIIAKEPEYKQVVYHGDNGEVLIAQLGSNEVKSGKRYRYVRVDYDKIDKSKAIYQLQPIEDSQRTYKRYTTSSNRQGTLNKYPPKKTEAIDSNLINMTYNTWLSRVSR